MSSENSKATRDKRVKRRPVANLVSVRNSADAVSANEAPVKLDKYAPGISRTFWIILALCAAAAVLGMGRNEAAQYQQAIEQLRSVAKHSRSIADVESQLRTRLSPTVGLPIVRQIVGAAEIKGVRANEAELLQKMRYIWVKDGPLSFDFSIAPAELLKKIDEIRLGKPYIVKVPALAGDEIAAVIIGLASNANTIVDAGFSCNWANDQCDSEIFLAPAAPGLNVRRLKFFVPARELTTDIRPQDVLALPDYPKALAIPRVRELENELAGKTYDQSLNYLAQRASEKEGSIKVFDITFSGVTAFLVLPLAIIGSLGWLLLQLRELEKMEFRKNDLRNEAMEIFYEDRIGASAICLIVACVPFGALALLTRLAPPDRWDVIGVLVTGTLIAGTLSFLVLRQRSVIRRREMAVPYAKINPPAA